MSRPDPSERKPEETPPQQGNTPAEPEDQSTPDENKGKIKEVIEKAKKGFDDLGDQKIGAKIGDDPA